MLKTLLSTIAAISLTGTSFANFSYIANQNESSNSLSDFLKKDIEENKISLGKQSFIEYDNQRFTNENALKNYFLSNSIVQSQFTSSNPYKIIKDYSNMILDETKIYDLNINNFEQVYRNAYGDVSQTSIRALNTYANLNFTKEYYSYDSQTWWDSPEEAKVNQKNNLAIHKSLYYFHEGKYYNAFNPQDINDFLKTFVPGYYVNKTKNLSGESLKNPLVMWGDEKLLVNNFPAKIQDEFLKDYFYKISKMEVSNKLIVTPNHDNEFRVDFHDGVKQLENKSGTPFTIQFANFNSYPSYTEMLKDFKNTSKWEDNYENDSGSIRHYWTRDFYIVNPKNGSKKNATIKLLPEWPQLWGTSWPSMDGYDYQDSTSSVLYTYGDESKTGEPVRTLGDIEGEIDEAYDLTMVSDQQKRDTFEIWLNSYYIPQKVAQFSNTNSFSYDDLKKGIYIKNDDQDVYKDLIYSLNYENGKSWSVIQSYLDYQEKKKQLLAKTPIIENGVKKYQMYDGVNFYASEQQLDNYLFLDGITFSPIMKYSFGTDEDQSSQDGSLLANTLQEAKEKAFINSNPFLKKKYIACDFSGNVQAEGSTREQAINAVHNKIKLESKLVNKKEIREWDWDLPISFDQIISDGKYVIYKLKVDSKTDLYFPTEDLVIKAAMSTAKQNGEMNNVYMDKYLYTYFDSTNQKQISVIFYDDDIDSAIYQILEQINYQNIYNNVIENEKNTVQRCFFHFRAFKEFCVNSKNRKINYNKFLGVIHEKQETRFFWTSIRFIAWKWRWFINGAERWRFD